MRLERSQGPEAVKRGGGRWVSELLLCVCVRERERKRERERVLSKDNKSLNEFQLVNDNFED